jgi:hypothetical protein
MQKESAGTPISSSTRGVRQMRVSESSVVRRQADGVTAWISENILRERRHSVVPASRRRPASRR